MIQHDFKVAFRNLLKYKTQNLISTVGLAVGLLCFCICFYCSRYMQSTDQCFDNYHRLVDINLIREGGEMLAGTPAELAEKLMKEYGHEVEAYSRAAYADERPFDVYLSDEKKLPYTFECIEVDSLFNRLFTPTVLAGSWTAAAHTPNAVVLTESAARKAFHLPEEAIGKRMVLTKKMWSSPQTTPSGGGIAYTIQAVIKDIPTNISMNFMQTTHAFILNDSEGIFRMKANNAQTGVCTYGLLHPGQTAERLCAVYKKRKVTYYMFNDDYDVVASPIGKKAYCADIVSLFSSITGIVGILILLVALLNFFHFQIGGIINRQREFAIRKVLGNTTLRLTGMLFTQLLLIIAIASLFMFSLIEVLASRMHISLFNLSLSINRNSLMMQATEYIAILLFATLLICFSVAFYIRKRNIQSGISHRNKRKGHYFRNTMLGIQFFICWLFVSMTVALYLQTEITTSTLFNTLTKADKNTILSLPLHYTFMKNEEKLNLIERFKQHAGVKEILLSENSYTYDPSNTGVQLEKGSNQWIEVNIIHINPNFLSFMNIPLSAGRNIESENDMFVDEVFRDKHKKDILGECLYDYRSVYTVCGIVSPFNPSVYGKERNGTIFKLSKSGENIGHCYLKCYPGKEKEVAQWMLGVLREVLPESIEPQITTFLEDINEKQAVETKLKDIILFFSIVSLIITLLGVYAAITLDTQRRQKEVAIRKVNGAGMKQIILLFARLYILLLTITAIVAFPAVYMVLQIWKEMYLVFFNVGVVYWGSIFIGIALLTIITVIFRIVKIARINPAEVIKNE